MSGRGRSKGRKDARSVERQEEVSEQVEQMVSVDEIVSQEEVNVDEVGMSESVKEGNESSIEYMMKIMMAQMNKMDSKMDMSQQETLNKIEEIKLDLNIVKAINESVIERMDKLEEKHDKQREQDIRENKENMRQNVEWLEAKMEGMKLECKKDVQRIDEVIEGMNVEKEQVKKQNDEAFDNIYMILRREVEGFNKKMDEEVVRVDLLEQKVSVNVEKIYKDIEEKEKKQEHVLEDIKERCSETFEEIKERIVQMEREKRSCTYINPMSTDIGVKFDGNNQRIHPKIFMKSLLNILKHMNDYEEMKEVIKKNMYGDALLWFTTKQSEITNIFDFEQKFNSYFWGELQQSIVRERLYFGKFSEGKDRNLSRYAMTMYSQAQFLEPEINENDIVVYIARHFKHQISETIALQNIKTMDVLVSYLMRIERMGWKYDHESKEERMNVGTDEQKRDWVNERRNENRNDWNRWNAGNKWDRSRDWNRNKNRWYDGPRRDNRTNSIRRKMNGKPYRWNPNRKRNDVAGGGSMGQNNPRVNNVRINVSERRDENMVERVDIHDNPMDEIGICEEGVMNGNRNTNTRQNF